MVNANLVIETAQGRAAGDNAGRKGELSPTHVESAQQQKQDAQFGFLRDTAGDLQGEKGRGEASVGNSYGVYGQLRREVILL